MEGVPADLRTITARLTEDEEGDKATMPDATCGLTRGLTTDTMTTSVYKYENAKRCKQYQYKYTGGLHQF